MHRGNHFASRSVRSLRWLPRDEAPGSPRLPGETPDPRRRPRLRGLALALTGLVVALAALRVLSTVAARGTGAPAGAARADDVLLLLLAWLGVGLAAWLALGSLLAVLATLPGAAGRVAADLAERLTPLAARKALTLVLGASVGSVALPVAPVSGAGSGAVPGPVSVRGAGAGTADPDGVAGSVYLGPGFVPSRASVPDSAPESMPQSVPGPGFTPTNATVAKAPGDEPRAGAGGSAAAPAAATSAVTPAFVPTTRGPGEPRPSGAGPGYVPSAPPPVLVADRTRLLAPQPRPTAGTHDVVTVHRGDSLWSVAARHLGPGAGDAEIAREWPRWYAANRDVIGDDPDLLVPGQQLRPPTALSPTTASTPSVDVTTPAPAQRGAHR